MGLKVCKITRQFQGRDATCHWLESDGSTIAEGMYIYHDETEASLVHGLARLALVRELCTYVAIGAVRTVKPSGQDLIAAFLASIEAGQPLADELERPRGSTPDALIFAQLRLDVAAYPAAERSKRRFHAAWGYVGISTTQVQSEGWGALVVEGDLLRMKRIGLHQVLGAGMYPDCYSVKYLGGGVARSLEIGETHDWSQASVTHMLDIGELQIIRDEAYAKMLIEQAQAGTLQQLNPGKDTCAWVRVIVPADDQPLECGDI